MNGSVVERETVAAVPGGVRRVVDVARVLTAGWPLMFAWPLAILAVTFVINLAIFAAIGGATAGDTGGMTGALVSVYIVMGVTHLQTMTQLFPFVLGLGVTRRAFYLATTLVVVAQSVVFGLVLVVLEAIERATGGWGVQMTFFSLDFLRQPNTPALWLVYTVPFLALSAVGMFVGVVFRRWGQPGVYVVSIATAVLAAVAAIVVTWQRWWPAIGAFFVAQSTFALFAGYPLVIAIVLGGAGYLVIRRAAG